MSSIQTHKNSVTACTEVYCMPDYSIYTKGEHVIQNIPCKSNTAPLLTTTLLTHSLPPKCICECCNVLLRNFCIIHSSNQHIPCGGLGAFASAPSDQAFLYCFFIIQGMGTDACRYCGCIEPHSFKDRPPIACSLSAHMSSEEHKMV